MKNSVLGLIVVACFAGIVYADATWYEDIGSDLYPEGHTCGSQNCWDDFRSYVVCITGDVYDSYQTRCQLFKNATEMYNHVCYSYISPDTLTESDHDHNYTHPYAELPDYSYNHKTYGRWGTGSWYYDGGRAYTILHNQLP